MSDDIIGPVKSLSEVIDRIEKMREELAGLQGFLEGIENNATPPSGESKKSTS
jgi:hypothetical protein